MYIEIIAERNYNKYVGNKKRQGAANAANEKLNHRRDILASRGKRKPDIDTIESCLEFRKSYAMFHNYEYFFFEQFLP